MKLSDYVWAYLRDKVSTVYMLPGGGAMHLVDSLGTSGIRYVTVLHEQAGALAAQADAMYTGGLGCELVTSGPGGTNAITGCATAWAESFPVLFISGQAKRETLMGNTGVRQRGSQEVNILEMVESITKHSAQVTDPSEIRYQLERAVFMAHEGRPGPVWLDIPVDVQGCDIDPESLRGFSRVPSPYSDKILADHMNDVIWKTKVLLANSKRPVILAGYGIQAAGAENEFRQLVERLGVPVLLTWKAIGLLPDDHPLYVGRPGKIGQRGANFAQQTCDLLISIGARLDYEQVAFQPRNFAPRANKVVVDVDLSELHKLDMDLRISVARDAGEFVRELLTYGERTDRPQWVQQCATWKKKYPVVLPEYRYGDDLLRVHSYVFMDDLSAACSADDVLAPGSSGQGVEVFMQAWKVKAGQRFIFAPGLGAMGCDIPMALGACVASGRRTICITGDGGFQLNIQDLETIHRLNLPVKFFVLSNGGYGSIMSMQRNYFAGRYVGSEPSSGLTLPDLVKIGDAYGFTTFKIMTNLKSVATIKEALATPGPVLVEVVTDPMQQQQPRVASRILPDGSIESAPMEDLYPFLPREDFDAEMRLTAG